MQFLPPPGSFSLPSPPDTAKFFPSGNFVRKRSLPTILPYVVDRLLSPPEASVPHRIEHADPSMKSGPQSFTRQFSLNARTDLPLLCPSRSIFPFSNLERKCMPLSLCVASSMGLASKFFFRTEEGAKGAKNLGSLAARRTYSSFFSFSLFLQLESRLPPLLIKKSFLFFPGSGAEGGPLHGWEHGFGIDFFFFLLRFFWHLGTRSGGGWAPPLPSYRGWCSEPGPATPPDLEL